MAYVQKTTDEEEQQGGAPAGPEKVLSEGTSGADDGQADAQPAAQAQGAQSTPGKQKGSGWTNLVDYVNANREAGQSMAGKVVQGVQDRGAQAQQQGQGFRNTASQVVSAATPQRDDSILTDLQNDPTKVAGDRAKQFQAMRTAEYQGPKAAQDVGGYQDARSAYDKTAQDAEAAQDFEARRGLLSNAYGNRSDYSAGESRLDSFLTGAGGGQQLAETRQAYGKDSGFQKGWGDLVSSVSGDIGKADAAAKKTAADTQAALESAVGASDKKFADYSKKASDTNAANTASFKALDTQLRSGDAATRARAFAEIGLDASTGEWLASQGYSLPQLVEAGKSMTGGDFASDQDVANAKALYGLKGANLDPSVIAKSGADGAAYGKNAKAMKSAADAKAIQESVAARLAAQEKARNSEWEGLAHEFTSFTGPSDSALAKLGMSRDDYNFAYQQGIDPLAYAKRSGAKLTAGDVATAQERQGWADLMAGLGLNSGTFDLQDKQDEGGAFSFDKAGFGGAVQAKRDHVAAQKAAAAAAARKAAEEEAARQALASQASAAPGAAASVIPYVPGPALPTLMNPSPKPGGTAGRILSDKRTKTDVQDVDDDEVGSFLKSLGGKK